MNYHLLHDVIDLVEKFEKQYTIKSEANINDFVNWLSSNNSTSSNNNDLEWVGKANGRTPESVISTLLLHMNRYAKSYSKSAIAHSSFSTQEEFIYLINLRAFGSMTKMSLIKMNKHEKPVGMQTINRLINMGWVQQVNSPSDKRSKVLSLTITGEEALEAQMNNIRKATQLVTGNLTMEEKLDLIRLLTKLDLFHQDIYDKNFSTEELLAQAYDQYLIKNK